MSKLRIAMPAWEPGRAQSGLGVKVGGLAVVLEELPEELVATAKSNGQELEIEVLTPCFAHYDRSQLEKSDLLVPVRLDNQVFEFEIYRKCFSPQISMTYFWDPGQLGWTTESAIYPDDPEMAFRLFATVSQAMAGYIVRRGNFHVIHGHDYHVGLIPFYLGDEFLREVCFHFTIHNASYQGIYPVDGAGFEKLEQINLPGKELFHRYFDFFDNLNFTKATLLKAHETGGKITTVSGDWEGSWGYAAELRESAESLRSRASRLSEGRPAVDLFLPNRHLDLFEKLPILGITNGLSVQNRPENLSELKASYLKKIQDRLEEGTIFRSPVVQREMLSSDHNFSLGNLEMKKELKRLLGLELYGDEIGEDTILLTAVGRLVRQKHFDLIAEIIEPVLALDSGIRFALLASASQGDDQGRELKRRFHEIATRRPGRVFFDSRFNGPLSRLVIAGGDFSLIPSRFEPCGLVDYEASLLGTIVIGHRTGGLEKVRDCAYLYDWLDMGDLRGEAEVFLSRIREAIEVYRSQPEVHSELIEKAMSLDAGWGSSAEQYLAVYRYGLLKGRWELEKAKLLSRVDDFAEELLRIQPEFGVLYTPVPGDVLNDRLRKRLMNSQ